MSGPDPQPGRIPYRLRVGVTGHRHLADEAAVAAKVGEALATVRARLPGREATPVLLTVVSPLAEGADRLVVREVLRDRTADLDAVLPLPVDDYVTDFPATAADFHALYRAAATRMELPDPAPRQPDRDKARSQAYRQVGRYVVDHCDVLVAVWDGEEAAGVGGTAEIVAYARKRRLPVAWVNPISGAVAYERLDRLRPDALDALDAFNRHPIGTEVFAREIAAQWTSFVPEDASSLPAVPFTDLAAWLLPSFVRADALALRYQRAHHSLATPIFVLSTFAVGMAGAHAVFFHEEGGEWLLFGEVFCLIALLAVLALGLWRRPSRRWIAYRFLAERLRSAYFLAAAGLDDRSTAQLSSVSVDDPAAAAWVSRAYNEVWKARPTVVVPTAEVAGLRRFLVQAWVRGQGNYHARTSHRYERAHHRLELAIWALLAIALAAPLLHLSGRLEGWAGWISLLSISLPAAGAGLTGWGEQREFELLAERYRRMEAELDEVAERMEEADDDIEVVWRIAADAESVMRQENRDWFGVMRFRDIAPHV